ncbi:MAG: type II secretion system protein [Candidatus Paceibacterota bacterium]
MIKKMSRGFTLIELLVVIAIIGILSAVVVANLNSARTKGADASVRANLSGIRTQAEIFYDNNSNRYNVDGSTAVTIADCKTAGNRTAGSVFADAAVSRALDQAGTNAASSATMVCNTDAAGQKWAVSVSLLKGTGSWCVDNQGWNKAGTAAAGICS